jgi:cholesterol transport system auxiliary component
VRSRIALSGPALVIVLVIGLPGCANLIPDLVPQPPPPPRSYDFGPVSDGRPAQLPFPVRLGDVQTPSWLQSPDLLYRRLDEQPGAVRAYAQSRWVAPPSELLAHRLSHVLADAIPEDAGRDAVLGMELLSFEQVFSAPDDAYVGVHARATLDHADGWSVQRRFSIRRASAPNVHGATRELPAAADELIEEIVAWLRDQRISVLP